MTVRLPKGVKKAGARAKKTQPVKPQTAKRKPRIREGSVADKGRDLLKASYGTGPNKGTADTDAVMGYYKGLPLKERKAAFRALEQARASRTNGLTGVLFQDLPSEARSAYVRAKGGSISGRSGTSAGSSGAKVAPWENYGSLPGSSVLKLGKDEESGGGGGRKKKGKGKGRPRKPAKGGRSRAGARKGQTIKRK